MSAGWAAYNGWIAAGISATCAVGVWWIVIASFIADRERAAARDRSQGDSRSGDLPQSLAEKPQSGSNTAGPESRR